MVVYYSWLLPKVAPIFFLVATLNTGAHGNDKYRAELHGYNWIYGGQESWLVTVINGFVHIVLSGVNSPCLRWEGKEYVCTVLPSCEHTRPQCSKSCRHLDSLVPWQTFAVDKSRQEMLEIKWLIKALICTLPSFASIVVQLHCNRPLPLTTSLTYCYYVNRPLIPLMYTGIGTIKKTRKRERKMCFDTYSAMYVALMARNLYKQSGFPLLNKVKYKICTRSCLVKKAHITFDACT